MTEILINDNIKITESQNIFIIEFKYSSYKIIQSLIKTHIIQGASSDETYKILKFKAQTVKTLRQYKNDKWINPYNYNMPINDVVKMVHYLSEQLNYLINKENSTILGYNIDEIIVINDDKFVFINNELVLNIEKDKKEMVKISSPFLITDFYISPEMLKIKEIPSFIHFKTSYFSFALLIIYCLVGDDDFYTNYLKHKHIENILKTLNNHPIKNTKLYWILSRCLDEEPTNRSIILI